MEEVKHIIHPNKTNECIVCGTKFVYQRQSMKYCSNACKCKAYQIRQTKNKLTKRINGTPGISIARNKQKNVPAQTTNNTSSIIEQQRQTIIQQKAYIEHLHKQADNFVKVVKYETSEQVRSAIQHTKDVIAMLEDMTKNYYDAKQEIADLKKQLRTNKDQMIGNIGAAIINNLKK